jgi:hypothetical protein
MERRFATLLKNTRKSGPPNHGWTAGLLQFLAPRPAALALYRLFLARMIDVEILSAGGDVRDLVVRSVSILSALSFVLAYMIVPRYISTSLPRARLLYSIWNDQEFLLSGTIAVAGLFSVLAWNAVFPDRRDCFVLSPLPVSTVTMILARLAAMATALSIGLIAINAFTGFGFPPAVAGPPGVFRSLAAWWITVFAAGAFMFSAMLAIQGLAAQLLSWSFFMRVSGLLQMAALFAVLALFFATPPFAATMLHPGFVVQILPSFWFTGLLHQLDGEANPGSWPLAVIAVRNLSLAIGVATIVWSLSWYRNVRRIVEAPDIAPAKGDGVVARSIRFLAFTMLRKPIDRAILMFTCRTIARSRQHRLVLAVCVGAGFATAFAFARTFLVDRSNARWNEPNAPFLIAGFLSLVCLIMALRAAFVMPQVLPANWIFRITAVHSPAAYFGAVRKSLTILGGVPVWIAATAYLAVWPVKPALGQIVVLVAGGLLLINRSLYQFSKIPFTCSWLPPGPQLKMRLGVRALLFAVLAGGVAQFELWSMEQPVRFAVLLAILIVLAVRASRRSTEFAASPAATLQFDDAPPAEIFALDLSREADQTSDDSYLDSIEMYNRT